MSLIPPSDEPTGRRIAEPGRRAGRHQPQSERRVIRLAASQAVSSGESLEPMLGLVPVPLIVVDGGGTIVLANDLVAELLGWERDELTGLKLATLVPERFRASHSGHFQRYLQAPETRSLNTGLEFWALCRDGSEMPVDIALRPLDGSGPTLIVAAIRDLSRQREADEALQSALAELQVARDRLAEENIYLLEELREDLDYDHIVGDSEPWRHVMAQVKLVACTDSTVLISGETGTGKELLAWAVHRESQRRDRPLITVNCAVLPSTLIESELFGHVKGAFSGADRLRKGRFELADGGTLLLDEIGELPPELQAKLLQVLQTGEFERLGSSETLHSDVRVIAATNRDLAEEVQAGRFRSDLYYRLMVFPIQVPPLRERRDDIRLLAMYFLAQQDARRGKSIDAIPESAMAAMAAYDWPGNVRELKNLIERAAILSPGSTLQIDTSTLRPGAAVEGRDSLLPAEGPPVLEPTTRAASASLEAVDRAHILAVLESCDWKVKGRGNAAEQLGLKESTLRSRMKRLGITRP